MAGRGFNETLGASHAQILGVWGLRRLKPKLWGFFKFNTPIYYGFIIILFCVARSVFGQNIFIHFCLIVFLVNYLFLVIIYKLFLKDEFLVSMVILLDTIWWIGQNIKLF